MRRKVENFYRYAAGRKRLPRSDSDSSSDGDSDKPEVARKPARQSKQDRRAKKVAKRQGRNDNSKAKKSSYRQKYPDPRMSAKEESAWAENWSMGTPYPKDRRRYIPVLRAYAVKNTPDTEARLVRPATLPPMTYPQVPRDFWRDGVMIGPVPKSDKDSGYGSDSAVGDNIVSYYRPEQDQISPPAWYRGAEVKPNSNFHVAWRKAKTTKSGYRYQCREIDGYKDGVIRFWAQGDFPEGGRYYMERHDDYRRKLQKSITAEDNSD